LYFCYSETHNLTETTCVIVSEQSEDAVESPVAMETEIPLPISQAGAAYSEFTVLPQKLFTSFISHAT